MPLPDLNWPENLFSDVIKQPSEIMAGSDGGTSDSRLWNVIVEAWVRHDAVPQPRWYTRLLGPQQIAV